MTDGALSPHSSTGPPRARKRPPGPGTFLYRGKGSPGAGEGRAAPGRGAGPARRGGRGRRLLRGRCVFSPGRAPLGASFRAGSPAAPLAAPVPAPRLRPQPPGLTSPPSHPSAAARAGHLASRPPPPRTLFWGRRRLFNTRYPTGAPRVIFTADLQGRRRPGAARVPLASPRTFAAREIFAGSGRREAGAGAPANSPGSCPAAPAGAAPGPGLRRRALPTSSARNLFTSNYQKINVLRTALLICYN